jgi:predicted PurR-regulated permease PerM
MDRSDTSSADCVSAGSRQALYVALLYLVLQSVDGYLLTPLVDRKSVELPPVLMITAQVVLGLAFGFIGILLASPLTAVALILIKMLYIEDLLGDRMMRTYKEGTDDESTGN